MKTRCALVGSMLAVAALVACGGGGGGGGNPMPNISPATVPTATPTTGPTPTPPTPTPVPQSYVFQGTSTRTDTYNYGFPSPEPPATLTASVTQRLTTGKNPDPTGAKGDDENIVETDAYPNQTQTVTTDSWVRTSNGNTVLDATNAVVGLGATASTIATTYPLPQLILQGTGGSWSNSPASTVTTTLPSLPGGPGIDTISANGTYSNYFQIAGATEPVRMSDYTTGGGSYTGPLFGTNGASLAFSAPGIPNPQPTPPFTTPVVTITIGGLGSGFQTIYDAPFWGAGAPPLYAESDTATPNVTLPSQCAPNSYANSATMIARKITTIDPILGTIDAAEQDTYLDMHTPICVLENETENIAYDYQGDQPFSVAFGSPTDHIVTVSEALILQAGNTIESESRRSSALSHTTFAQTATLVNAPAVAALQSTFRAQIAYRHMLLRAEYVHALEHTHLPSQLKGETPR